MITISALSRDLNLRYSCCVSNIPGGVTKDMWWLFLLELCANFTCTPVPFCVSNVSLALPLWCFQLPGHHRSSGGGRGGEEKGGVQPGGGKSTSSSQHLFSNPLPCPERAAEARRWCGPVHSHSLTHSNKTVSFLFRLPFPTHHLVCLLSPSDGVRRLTMQWTSSSRVCCTMLRR